ncbi:FAD-dependent oxidoreductase [Rhizobium leguminosarum]|uniref:FAD-dependent oxidoreductase n=1 Tax=Rhizobium leguminosarum TaxID=384 RepID=UPI003F97B251
MPTTSNIGNVVALWRYPVSSLSGELLQRARLTESGLAGDRRFAIVDEETLEPINPAKRQWYPAPRLLSKLDEENCPLISLDGVDWHRHDETSLRQKLSLFFGRPVSVHSYGTRLSEKVIAHRYKLSPIHLLSRQSIQSLKKLLPSSMIDERRFRPNILVDLDFDDRSQAPENHLLGQEFQIGGLRLRASEECGRCNFTTLEQFGVPEDRSVLRALIGQFEKNFGIYCEVLEDGYVAVGDEITWSAVVPAAPRPIVIVGAGQAGGTVARALRELGHRGPIEVFGEEGYVPYERPPLSKNFHIAGSDQKPLTEVLSHADADALGVNLHLGEKVVHIDRSAKTIETVDGRSHAYQRLVIATGGSARKVALLNRGFGRIHSIRTADDAEKLRRGLGAAKRIFVLGGGWLGLEVAAAARAASIEVDLFVRQSHLCSRVLPKVVAEFVADVHVRNGVKLHLGREPSFSEHADRVEAEFAGSVLKADLLVIAIGITANDHLARRAGLDCRDGIFTNPNGETVDPHVYAVGDVSRQREGRLADGIRIESWQNAAEQATRAARAMLGLDVPPAPLPRFWSEQYDLLIQIAGLPNPSATPLRISGTHNRFWEFEHFVVGINRQREVHQFAMKRTTAAVSNNEPETRCEPAGNFTKHLLAGVAPIEDGEVVRASFEPVGEIVLTRQGENYFALQDRCPHADASLSEGFVDGCRIVCPLHFAEFDLTTGAAHNAPKGCQNAKAYRVEPQNGALFIYVPDLS